MNQTAAETVQQLPIALIAESPTNARKVFRGMEELIASVAEKGVVQPIVVRPLGDGYEVVFGHRRRRASIDAGRESIPAIVREYSDQEAWEVQLIENVQRQDLHAMEEAESYEQLRTLYNYTVDQLIEKTGKSRRWVYDRLKLLELGPEGRQAFLEDRLSPSTALLVARVPKALQAKAVKAIAADENGDGAYSAREAARWIAQNCTKNLDRAPFTITDAELHPDAGACAACPKLSGNDPALLDAVGPNMCTDPSCYGTKVEKFVILKSADIIANGGRVATKQESEKIAPYGFPNHPYISLGSECRLDPKKRTWRQVLGKKPKNVILLNTGADILQVLKESDALAQAYEGGNKWAKPKPKESDSGAPVDPAERKREKEKAEKEQQLERALLRAVRDAAAKKATLARWVVEEVLQLELENGDDETEKALDLPSGGVFGKDFTKFVEGKKDNELVGLLTALLFSVRYDKGLRARVLDELKIDPKKVKIEEPAPPEPPKAAAAPKKAAPAKAAKAKPAAKKAGKKTGTKK